MARTAPIRTCIACGATSDKRSLMRFVRTPQGEVMLDASGKTAGRGAYVCGDAACFANACDKRLFEKRLRTKMGTEDYKRLRAEFDAYAQERACAD